MYLGGRGRERQLAVNNGGGVEERKEECSVGSCSKQFEKQVIERSRNLS